MQKVWWHPVVSWLSKWAAQDEKEFSKPTSAPMPRLLPLFGVSNVRSSQTRSANFWCLHKTIKRIRRAGLLGTILPEELRCPGTATTGILQLTITCTTLRLRTTKSYWKVWVKSPDFVRPISRQLGPGYTGTCSPEIAVATLQETSISLQEKVPIVSHNFNPRFLQETCRFPCQK